MFPVLASWPSTGSVDGRVVVFVQYCLRKAVFLTARAEWRLLTQWFSLRVVCLREICR